MQIKRMRWTRYITALVATMLAGAAAADPVGTRSDGNPVTLTGEVVHATDRSFTLDYGQGVILVEMNEWGPLDQWGPLRDGKAIHAGETVRVTGLMDKAFFEKQTIEAGTVYVYDRNTVYASGKDRTRTVSYAYAYDLPPPLGTWVDLQGTVASVDEREFVIRTSGGPITVNTIDMAYNPLDEIGVQRIEKGDLVSVFGEVEPDLFGNLEIHAENVTSFSSG